uniref:Uncharacterized protein n=1 Tax=Micrurus spixii TaxID=129469 RepID=A0A2D4MFY8_9SAUR
MKDILIEKGCSENGNAESISTVHTAIHFPADEATKPSQYFCIKYNSCVLHSPSFSVMHCESLHDKQVFLDDHPTEEFIVKTLPGSNNAVSSLLGLVCIGFILQTHLHYFHFAKDTNSFLLKNRVRLRESDWSKVTPTAFTAKVGFQLFAF